MQAGTAIEMDLATFAPFRPRFPWITADLQTVRNYLSEAIGKLGVGNRIEAYRLARQKGWL